MAITESALASAIKSNGGGTFTTAATVSVTPGANQLVLADVFHNASVAGAAANPTGVAGAGLTFTLVDSIVDTAAGSVLSRWRAMSASPIAGAITATFANATLAAVISTHQYNGVDTSGTNGSGAIVQTAKNSNNTGSVATITATLAAFGSVNNGASSANGWFNASGTVPTATPDTGWTEIHDTGTTYSGATLADALETQWRATNDTTALATWSANGAVYSIASELKAASANVTITPPAGTLVLAGQVPAVLVSANQTIAVPAGALALTGNAPSVLTPVTVAVPAGALSLTGQTPTVAVTANQVIAVPSGTLSLSGQIPTVALSNHQLVAVPAGALSLTGLTPIVLTGGAIVVSVPAGSMSLTGLAPTVTASANQTVAVPAGALTLTANAPTILSGITVNVPLGQLVLTSLVPSIGLTQNVLIAVPAGQLTLSAVPPVVLGSLSPPTGEVAAGRRRIREIYRITIDGQIFECHSLAEALELLAAAKALAQQIAADKAQTALALRRPATPAAMALPQITVSSRELRAAVTETKREIAQVYRQALIDAEIAMLFELDDRARHNDDALMLLM